MEYTDSLVVAFVGESTARESLISTLERDHDLSVNVFVDETKSDTSDTRADCVVVDSASLAGRERLDTLRKRFPNVPVVVLCETSEAVAQLLDTGVDRCVRHSRSDEPHDGVAVELAAVVRACVRERRRVADSEASLTESALDTLQDIFFVFDLEGTFLQWNWRLTAVTGYGDEELSEMFPTDFIAPEDVDAVADAISHAIDTGQAQVDASFLTADGERIPYEFTGSLLRDEVGAPLAVCGTGRDITERQRRERALEEHTERLQTLNHINAVIRDVNSVLVRKSSREAIEQAVCNHLVGDTPYCFAWVGDIGLTGTDIEPRAWAGVEDGYLDERLTGDPVDAEVTAASAIREGCVLVSQNIAADVDDATWRDAALARGYRSVAAIPLVYRDSSYGVLCVYAPREGAFDETERVVLGELGETIAYAISTTEQRRALVTDTVVELECTLTDGPFFVVASDALDCTLSLDGLTQGPNGDLAEFVSVRGVVPSAVVDLAEARGWFATIVADYGDAGVLQVSTPGPSLAAFVADRGGVLRDAEAERGTGTVRIELPQTADLRSVVRGLQAQFPTVELAATRERERTSTRGLEFRETFDDALTDRQREVLEAAYLAGYFEWPRGSTAEEVADTLDVSAPTFHEHLRRIQQKLVDTFFETSPPPTR